jgi:hypothetical protein
MAGGRTQGPSRTFRFFCWVACSSLTVLSPSVARAGGPAFYRDRAGWHPLGDEDERAFVVVADGVEHLFSIVRLDPALAVKDATELAWLVPIPASAEKVSANPLRDFPSFSGRQPVLDVRRSAASWLELMAASQLWPLPALLARFWDDRLERGIDRFSFTATSSEGVTTEILSSQGAAALVESLRRRDIDLAGQAPISSSTEGPTWSWVLVRVADLAAFHRGAGVKLAETGLGVAVHFPTAHGYYPLLTSGQRGLSRAIEITTLGFTRPSAPTVYEVTTEQCLGNIEASGELQRSARLDVTDRRQPFTRFRLSTKDARARGEPVPTSSAADFLFEPGAPDAVLRAADWLRFPYGGALAFVAALCVFLGLSLAAHFSVRALWPKASRPLVPLCARIAVANVFTIVSPLTVARNRAQTEGRSARAAIAFVLTSSVLFTSFLTLLHWLIAPS